MASTVYPRVTIKHNKQGEGAVTNSLATAAGSLRTLHAKALLVIRTEECWPNESDDLPLALDPFSAVMF